MQFPHAIAVLASQPRAAVLVALVAAAAVCDWRTRRLPNALNAAGAIAGVLLAIASVGAGPAWLASLAGCALGLALMLPLYALRTMGAGDVKLMAAVGAFVGPSAVAYCVLFTFIAGGLLAFAWTASQRSLPRVAQNLRAVIFASMSGQSPASAIESVGRMPYALAVCAGTVACLWLRQPFLP